MLSEYKLDTMKPSYVFASGIDWIPHPYDVGYVKAKWVAVRGRGVGDWAIYHSFNSYFVSHLDIHGEEGSHLTASDVEVAQRGSKILNEDVIRNLVKCDERSWRRYRL